MYLPRLDRERFGVGVVAGRLDGPAELLVAFEAERGLGWLERGLELVPLLDRRSASCVLAMTGAYGRLLERIAADPAAVLSSRPSLRSWEKGWVLARSLATYRQKRGGGQLEVWLGGDGSLGDPVEPLVGVIGQLRSSTGRSTPVGRGFGDRMDT